MKDMFSCTLKGKNWWKPFLGYLAILVYIQVQLHFIRQAYPTMTETTTMLLLFAELIVTQIVAATFGILLMRISIPSISIRGSHFSFAGNIGEYVSLHLIGFFLTLLTLGIYYPWYRRRVTDYIASKTSLAGSPFSFKGSAGTLLKYLFLAFFIPMLVWILLFVSIFGIIRQTSVRLEEIPVNIVLGIYYFAILILLVPSFYLLVKWNVNFERKGQTIIMETEFWPSMKVVAKEITLTLLTLGIYWPAMIIKFFHFFLGKIVIRSERAEIGRFSFGGTLRDGFGFLWGQTLLTIVTLGVYLPWAYANAVRWFIVKIGLTAEQLAIEE